MATYAETCSKVGHDTKLSTLSELIYDVSSSCLLTLIPLTWNMG